VRFVEDDWENPTLGAWGLGWEVWLNGMEVTQFTYFQQVGGLDCNPITSEITYGLERLAMYLQGKENVFDLVWAATTDDGVTQSLATATSITRTKSGSRRTTRAVGRAETDRAVQVFRKRGETPARRTSAASRLRNDPQGRALFNLLDARGAVSVTERAGYIGRITRCRARSRRRTSTRAGARFPDADRPPARAA
jgi:glycyl-tRNA synthetase alpha chain